MKIILGLLFIIFAPNLWAHYEEHVKDNHPQFITENDLKARPCAHSTSNSQPQTLIKYSQSCQNQKNKDSDDLSIFFLMQGMSFLGFLSAYLSYKYLFVKPAEVHRGFGTYNLAECSICLDNYIKLAPSHLDCGHTFHYKCILPWMIQTNQCPFCRNE